MRMTDRWPRTPGWYFYRNLASGSPLQVVCVSYGFKGTPEAGALGILDIHRETVIGFEMLKSQLADEGSACIWSNRPVPEPMNNDAGWRIHRDAGAPLQ